MEPRKPLDKSQVRQRIAALEDLPTLSTVVVQLFETAADPNASALDLAKHLAADQSLCAALLRLVNSAYYGFYRQVSSVTDAVVILGFSKVRDLALTATAFTALPDIRSAFDRTQLWRHSLGVAIAADRIAKALGLSPDKGHFSAGLLHDMGKVTFDLLYPEDYVETVNLAHDQEQPVWKAEDAHFGVSHAELGALLGEHWNLPQPLVDAIRHHHDAVIEMENQELTHVTALANFVVYRAGLGEYSNGCPPELPETSVQYLGVAEAQWTRIAEELGTSHQRIDALLGVLPD